MNGLNEPITLESERLFRAAEEARKAAHQAAAQSRQVALLCREALLRALGNLEKARANSVSNEAERDLRRN